MEVLVQRSTGITGKSFSTIKNSLGQKFQPRNCNSYVLLCFSTFIIRGKNCCNCLLIGLKKSFDMILSNVNLIITENMMVDWAEVGGSYNNRVKTDVLRIRDLTEIE